jgi:hypothetical protein
MQKEETRRWRKERRRNYRTSCPSFIGRRNCGDGKYKGNAIINRPAICFSPDSKLLTADVRTGFYSLQGRCLFFLFDTSVLSKGGPVTQSV